MGVKFYKTNYKCSCGKEGKIEFKKPYTYTGTLISHTCLDCGKKIIIRIFKDHKVKNQFKVYSRELEN